MISQIETRNCAIQHRFRFTGLLAMILFCFIFRTSDVKADRPEVNLDQKISRRTEVGKLIFLDTSLSSPKGQACVSCHHPQHAFGDPRPQSPGAVTGRSGTRNAPSLMYAALIPSFAYDEFFTSEGDEVYAYEGGLFWDGRARDLFEQIQQPFLHPKEMNLGNESVLASRLRHSSYAEKLKTLVGPQQWDSDSMVTYHAYLCIVDFLQSPTFRPFDSKLDSYQDGNQTILNEAEKRGMQLYIEKAKCNDCHPLSAKHWERPLLSDFGYDNLGVPSVGKPDQGLGKHTGNEEEIGQFRSPSLRNVELTAPYMHNGSLKTLREVIEFYNARDTPQSRWKSTDFPHTVNREDLGDLKLSEHEIDDLLAFLNCFTDQCLKSINKNEIFPKPPTDTPTSTMKALYFPGWTHRLHPSYRNSTRETPQDREE